MKYPLLVSNPANIFYLTGVHIEARDAWVLLTEKETHFFTDARYSDVLASMKSPIIPHEISASSPLSTQIQQLLADLNKDYIYFEADNLTVLELATLKKKVPLTFKSTNGIMTKQREVKTPQEITKIKKACNTIDACLFDIKKLIRPGLTEYEIAYKLDSWLREKGYESAFPPIIAVNEHAAIPHFNTQKHGTNKITENSIILIDAGAKVDGYCSDISRMFIVGKPSTTFLNIYKKMLYVQEKTIAKLSTSKTYSEVDLFCRGECENHNIVPHRHATGHGIGIDVHEKPYVSFTSKDAIKSGQVVTIEPGTYVEGQYGIRIEDTVLLNPARLPIVLTKYPKAL